MNYDYQVQWPVQVSPMFLSPYLLSVDILGMLAGAVQYLCYLLLQLNVAGILDFVGRWLPKAPLLEEWPKDISHEYVFVPEIRFH